MSIKGVGLPVRPIELVLAGALTMCATIAQTTTMFGWAPVRWTEVNALPHVVLLVSGPVAGLIGAFGARACTTALVTTAPGRAWSQITRRQLAPLAAAACLGYIIGIVPAILLAAKRATYGHLDIVGVFTGSAGLVLCVVIGYAVGARVRFPKAAAVALAATVLATGGLMALSDLLTSSGVRASLLAVIPFWAFDISRGWVEVPTTTLFRGFTLVAVAALVLALLAIRRDAGWLSRRERLGQMGFAAAAPLLMVALALVVQPDVVRPAQPTPVRCATLADGALCMYSEEAAVLPRTTQIIDEVHARFGLGASTGNAWSVRPEDAPTAIQAGDILITPQYQGTVANFDESLRSDVVASISGVRACESTLYDRYGVDYPNQAPAEALESAVFQEKIGNSLVFRLGGTKVDGLVLPGDDGAAGWPRSEDLANRIGSMSDDELTNWMLMNAGALESCSARPDDLERG